MLDIRITKQDETVPIYNIENAPISCIRYDRGENERGETYETLTISFKEIPEQGLPFFVGTITNYHDEKVSPNRIEFTSDHYPTSRGVKRFSTKERLKSIDPKTMDFILNGLSSETPEARFILKKATDIASSEKSIEETIEGTYWETLLQNLNNVYSRTP